MKTFYILFLVMLVGCEFSQNDLGENNTRIVQSDYQIVSNWKTECVPGTGESYRLELVFDEAGSAIMYEYFYYGENCIEADSIWVNHMDYSISGETLHFSRRYALIVPMHRDTVDVFNQSGSEMCEIDSWTLGGAENVTNLDCEVFATEQSGISIDFNVEANTLTFAGHWWLEEEIFRRQ